MFAPQSEHAFDKDLTARLRSLRAPRRRGLAKWRPHQLAVLSGLILFLGWLLTHASNRFLAPDTLHVTLVLGTLGMWRFGWWFTHAIRAELYRRARWPGMRAKADAVWQSGWRPGPLHIQMTTYYEEPAITKRVIGSILAQIRRERIPTTLYIGTGSAYDEGIIRSFVETHAQDIPDDLAELVFLRQNQPGKRMAIGMTLRAINLNGVDPDDLVIFMDDDALYGGDVLEKTLSMFGADPELQALTTDEEVICYGPKWIAAWLDMRFAQRRLAMQSHAMSGNMLRNGSRAIALGPRQVKPFIWWCVVDQRLAMWTMMVSPTLAILAALTDPLYLWSCLIRVLASRILLCVFLYSYAREVDLSWPFILYLNQVINASVKIFMIFHLSKQKWSNRGNQSAGGGDGWAAQLQNATAKAQLCVAVDTFVTLLALYDGAIPAPF